jgi:Type I phosphodiesterase / nucleotide pyrophosphatase
VSAFNKKLCVGVAAAGLFGLGSAAATGVANAEPASSHPDSSASAAAAGPAKAGPGARPHSLSKAARPRPAASVSKTTSATAFATAAVAPTASQAAAPTTKNGAGVTPIRHPIKLAPTLLALLPGLVSPAGASRTRATTPAATVPQVDGPVTSQAAGTAQHVLVIGIDGTNLSAILADPANQNLFDLMDDGTTAASTMVGHTTMSNPSWSGILTGVWSETLGLFNNVNTPWTYDKWPTIFNQLETYNPAIETTAIGDWANIAQIAGAGSVPADNILYYPQINNSWLDTDDEVGNASVDAIENTTAGTPSFQFSYFVGVDDTGHQFDAGSPQYAAAIRNVDTNVGNIMDAVDTWNAANPDEQWTVLVTTDHGQVPWPTIRIGSDERAHGFQTPWETTTFVIADGPDFTPGTINNTYRNIDIAPTVAELFGLAPEPYSQGKPLMDRSANDYVPSTPGQDGIKQALTNAIAMYGYPNIATNVALVVRTVAGTIPYVVLTVFDGLAASVPQFLVFPVQLLGAIIYQATNIPAQIIARLTGVTGNQIIPPDLWPYTPIPGTQTESPAAPALVSV